MINKPRKEDQTLVKQRRRWKMPDLNMLLIQLILLCIAAALAPSLRFVPSDATGAMLYLLRLVILCAILIFVFTLRKAKEWERTIVLRLGKFHKVKGPGFFFIIPLVDQVHRTIDIRIRVMDFYAQETLTGDSVTIGVDAFCFWLVWDPQKAALEVEDYEEAVALASKAALRNVISKNDLSTFQEREDLIEKQIQEEVDKQTTEWGITVQYVEITDIQIPEELQNSLSRVAQAEREKKARVLLAEAEIEIAKKLEEAISIYAKNGDAMKLKILTILNEGLKAGNSMMLVPNSITEELKTRDVFGLAALNELQRKKPETRP
jgi:regulator of protease activity HflC (stomatin/prohibitin superfamily)